MTEEIVLSCKGIEKEFSLEDRRSPGLPVLRGVDLSVKKGEIICIVGASGSGKSTLLHILGGLDRPTSGEVSWMENAIFSMTDDALARLRNVSVGFVFQFHHLLAEFTALENVMIPMMIAGRNEEEMNKRAIGLLESVGLLDRVHHLPGELSGGEQQRVAVARALANSPSVVLADEPSGNLDSAGSRDLQDLLWNLNHLHGQTFVIVTHNERFAEKANRVFRMVDGKLVQS